MALSPRSTAAAALAVALAPAISTAEERRQDLTAIPVARRFNLIGAGVGLLPEFSGSDDHRVMVLPVVRVAWRDRVFWNMLQAGAWLWDSDDRSVRLGIAVEPRFGWEARAGSRVEGMQTRDFSLEGGPNVQWRTPAGVFNLNFYQDLGGASNGQTAQVQFIRVLVGAPALRVNASAGLQWFSGGMNDYYFGVRPGESAQGRPAWTARSSTSLQLGINGSWSPGGRGAVLFGLNGSRIGDGASDSPIVETRYQSVLYLGYGWTF